MKYNLVLPIAGKGQRFVDQGYALPKPLIPVKGRTILQWSLSSIKTDQCRLIFVINEQHQENNKLDFFLKILFGDDITTLVDHNPKGMTSSAFVARELIDNDDPLILVSPDVFWRPVFHPESIGKGYSGYLLTFKDENPSNSYLHAEGGRVIATAEKKQISKDACLGLYAFKRGRDFIEYSQRMMMKPEMKVNNEYYVAPLYNLMIQDGLKIGHGQVDRVVGLGTPELLKSGRNQLH